MALHPQKVWKRCVDDVYSILKCTHFENFFHHVNNLHQNIKFIVEEKSNGKLAFLDTLKMNNGKTSVLIYRKPMHIDQYLHYDSHYQTSCIESAVSTLFNGAYSIITNKDDLYKENGYQESIISKIFKRVTNNHSLPQSQQQMQATKGRDQNECKFTAR